MSGSTAGEFKTWLICTSSSQAEDGVGEGTLFLDPVRETPVQGSDTEVRQGCLVSPHRRRRVLGQRLDLPRSFCCSRVKRAEGVF